MKFTKSTIRIFIAVIAILSAIGSAPALETWFEIHPDPLPPKRVAFGMVYDLASERPIIFGGFDSTLGALDDTWAYQGNEWVQIKASTYPSKRYFHTFSYDPNTNSGIVVGGINDTGVLSDAWLYKDGDWSLIKADAIPGRHSHAAAFNSYNNTLYIYGGLGEDNTHLSDFWQYQIMETGGIWSKVPNGEIPGQIYGHSMVYDTFHNQIVLFGGADENNNRNNDTWVFKNDEWIKITTTNDPPTPRIYHKMVYVHEKEHVILFGGFEEGKRLNDLWIFKEDNWTYRSPVVSAPERSTHEIIFDPKLHRIDCVGGIGNANNYWDDMWVLYEILASFDKEEYSSIHDRAVITVSDLSSNFNPYDIDTIPIYIASDTDPVGIIINLIETDINSGIFKNDGDEDQKLKFSLAETSQAINQIKVSDSDTIYAKYTTPSEGYALLATAVWHGMESVMSWDKPVYIGFHDEAFLTVDNIDANLDPNTSETITVKVTSDANPTGINVFLMETSENSGIFTFPKGAKGLTFHPKYSSQAKVEIFVNDGDTLRMSFQNPLTGTIDSSTTYWRRNNISMEFDKDLYEGNEKAHIILYDADLNFNPDLSETVWLQYISDTDKVGIGIPAYETGPNTGVFDPGAIGFSTTGTSFTNRAIHVTDGDVVSMVHSMYLKQPYYAHTKWLSDYPPIQNRPAVFIIFGPEEDEVTTDTIITFHFTATGNTLNKIKPRNVEYKTKLLGYEEEWTPWIQGTTRIYKDLPGGEYVFMVQCRSPKPPAEGEGFWVSLPVLRRFYVNREGEPPLVTPQLVATPGNNFVNLEWLHPYRSNLLGYYIFRREEGQDEKALNPLPLDPAYSDYKDEPIIPHRRYEYFVRAVDMEGFIKDSNKVWCAACEDTPGSDTLVFSEDFLDMGTSSNEVELEVYNQTMNAPIYWTLYSDTPALKVEPASGIAFGGATNFKIKLNRKGYSVGSHELFLYIRSTAASYLPEGINEHNAIKIRFAIPGNIEHSSHTLWEPASVSRSTYEYIWVDLTPQKTNMYRDYQAAALSSNSTVDLSPWDLGSWPLANAYDVNPIRQAEGDQNGQINPDETVTLVIELKNTGVVEVRSATLMFYSTDEYVEILSPNFVMLNNICACDESFETYFKFHVSKDIPDTKEGYPFRLYGFVVDTDGYKWLFHIDLKAFNNFPLRHTYTIDDDILGFSFGNNNNIIEAGEKIEIPLTIHNTGVNQLPLIIYYLDQVTSPSKPILFQRSSFKSKYVVPPMTSQNVEGDFEFITSEVYDGGQIEFQLTSGFINPFLYDEYCMPERYLCSTGLSFPHPEGKVTDEGEPINCPLFQFAYGYVKEKKFAENSQGIKEGESYFTDGSDGWTAQLENPPFSPPLGGWDDQGQIYLQASNNVDCHGFWESPPNYSPIIKDNLYRARFTIFSDQEDPSLSPAFRLRAFDDLGGQADILVVASENTGICAPSTTPRTYNFYFVPNQDTGTSLRFAWDIINFNPNDAGEGTLFLDDLIIERFALDLLPVPFRLKHYNFFYDESGWEYSTIPNFFTPAIGYQTNGVLQFIGIDSNTYGSWSNPRLDIIQGENLRLYCAEITARRDFDTPQDQVPQIRIRINALNNQYAILKNINSEGTGENSLDIVDKTYKIFCYSPTDELGNPVQDVPLQVSVDYINFNASDYANSTVKIEEVSVDVYPPDPMP